MRIKVFIFIFLFLSAFLIISNGNLHMNNANEAKIFANHYYSWLLSLAGNALKTTGFIVGFDWLPNKNLSLNETFNTITNLTGISNNSNNLSK